MTRYMQRSATIRRLIAALMLLSALWNVQPWHVQVNGPVPTIDRIDLPASFDAGQSFVVEVWATNLGDAANGGSISISQPEGYAMSIVDSDAPASVPDVSLCQQNFDHTWVMQPGGACSEVLRNNTACKGHAIIRYPLTESWYTTWPSRVQHHLAVRILPDSTARQVTLYIRVAMRAAGGGCDLHMSPTDQEANAYDQQDFPVLSRIVTARSLPATATLPTPTNVPTLTPVPTLTAVPRPTSTQVTSTLAFTGTSSFSGTGTQPTGDPFGPLPLIGLLIIVTAVGGIVLRTKLRPPTPGPVISTATLPMAPPGPPTVMPFRSAAVCLVCGSNIPANTWRCVSCGAPVRVIGQRYQIVCRLGQGGMGAVYLVEDQRLTSKAWAVKEVSDAAIVDPIERQQAFYAFQQEAQLLAMLDHPNLPRVSDFFHEGNYHYLVMDYIDGETLEQLLSSRTRPFSESETLQWAAQLCDVLQYLHQWRPPIIFRDLKPSNIMLARNGRLKLIDFGIARLFKPGRPGDTTRLGTPGYSPPEQYGTGQTDARSDIFALGVTLHQLLTLHDPTLTPLTLPNVRQLNPNVSPRIEAAILRATQLDPNQRFQSAFEMRQFLGIT